jgi:hypothetical protein
MLNSCLLGEPPDQIALLWERMPRTVSSGKGDILNKDVRPYRKGAAAASNDGNGHGVDHGRGL